MGGAIAFLSDARLLATVHELFNGGLLYPTVATISNSHFADNWVVASEVFSFSDEAHERHIVPGGGAISSDFGPEITIDNSSFEGNRTLGGDGGAIKNGGSFGIDDPFGIFGDGPHNVGSADVLTLSSTTFANNEATTGRIRVVHGPCTLVDVQLPGYGNLRLGAQTGTAVGGRR